MAEALIEAVPNFSEGTDLAAVDRIWSAMAAVGDALLLDLHSDRDHNRSVITLAGPPDAVIESILRGTEQAVALIDLNRHSGVHPRIGAADVIPLVPLRNASLEECARWAVQLAEQLWQDLRVPVYLYEAAARLPERRDLARIRRGQFESLRLRVKEDPSARPDIGGPLLHPTAGASAIGARRFLIAYNVNFSAADPAAAKDIARLVRESSGGFPAVKALGVPLASRGLSQLTMNLVDIERVCPDELMAAIEELAAERGIRVVETEIVGLVPRRAFDRAPRFYQRAVNFRPEVILENRLAALQSK
ncbi:MAG: glutamate formimidoyltransferase [Bryobacteraceae bacterium]